MRSNFCLKKQGGFSLVELMIVVSIIGILAAVSLPAYQVYTAKASIGAALSEMSSFQGRIVEELSTSGSCPTENDTAWVASKVLAGYSIRASGDGDCSIAVKFKPSGVSTKVVDKVIEITAKQVSGGMISWECTSDAERSVLPGSCTHVDTPPAFP